MTPQPTPAGPDVLVITAHPQMQDSRVNRRLLQRARETAQGTAPRIVVRDLYALYPDYLIDVAAEQALLAPARLVVWQHPIHWYSMPPLMKLWVDEVLAFGWAYGPGGNALRGKDLWLVATTGGPEDSYHPESYNRYRFDAFLPPYEQTAALCGMRFLPPLLLHGAHKVEDVEVKLHEAVFAQRLGSHPDWPELAELEEVLCAVVPTDARPEDDDPHTSAEAAAGRALGRPGAGPHPLGGSAAVPGGRGAP